MILELATVHLDASKGGFFPIFTGPGVDHMAPDLHYLLNAELASLIEYAVNRSDWMRVFIGYGYNPRDKWVETYVIPIVKAFGCSVEHGKAVYGGALPDEVLKLIRACDAMIGFTTQLDEAGVDQAGQPLYTTHPWVVQELTAAMSQNPPIPFVEVREQGVISPGGMIDAFNPQRINYREAERADCLLNLCLALERFHQQLSVTTVRLGPALIADQISDLLDDPGFLCQCQVLRGDVPLPQVPTPVLPIKGSLFVKLRGIGKEDLVRITVSAGGRVWRSSYDSVDTVDVQLKAKE
jgi:hypothetical protein